MNANNPGLEQAYEAVLSEIHQAENTRDPGGLLSGLRAGLRLLEEASKENSEK